MTTYHLIQLPEVYLQYIMIQSSFIIIAAQRLSHESHVSYVSQQRPAVLPLVPRVETFATKGPTNDLAAFKGKAPDFHQRSQYLVPMEISLQMPHGLKQRQPPGSAPLLGTCETQVPRGRKLSEMMLRMQFREQRVKFGQMVQCSNLQIVKQCAAKQRMSTFYIQYSVEGRRSERPFSKKNDSWRRTSMTNNRIHHTINIMPSTSYNLNTSPAGQIHRGTRANRTAKKDYLFVPGSATSFIAHLNDCFTVCYAISDCVPDVFVFVFLFAKGGV